MDDLDLPVTGLSAADVLGGAAATERAARLAAGAKGAKAARDFEAVFLHRLLEEMRRTIPKAGLLETGTSDQVEGLFWFYLAQEVAERGGMGLAKELARHLGAAAQPAPPPPASGPQA